MPMTQEKSNVMKMLINKEAILIFIFLLLTHAQMFDRCVPR